MNPATILLLSAAIDAAIKIFEAANKFRSAALQSGEWSAEQELQFQTQIDRLKIAPHWKPDAT